MTRNKILAIAAAMTVMLTGCSYGYESDRNEKAKQTGNTDVSEDAGALGELNSTVERLLELTEESGNDEQIKECIAQLLDLHSGIFEDYEMAQMNYYKDINDKAAGDACDEAGSDYYAADDALYFAFSQGYNTDYQELFTDLVDLDYLDYYGASRMTLKKCEKNARESYESTDELQDSYYDAVYGDDFDMDELRLECAQMYLDTIQEIREEDFYGTFDRDYSPEDIMDISGTVYENLIPVYNRYLDELASIDGYEKIYDASADPDPFGTIAKYAGSISPGVGESARRISEEKLYTLTSGDNAVEMGYTIDLPKSDRAWIYNYSYGYSLLGDCIHEFGHFHAALCDPSYIFNAKHNMDIGEIQSQAMEILFLRFYDDIYGEQSRARRIDKILDLVDSVLMGFAIGEFETRVYQERDDITPEEVLELYDDIVGSIDPDYEFCYIDHLFTQPGYFVSYGVSALAAFSFFDDALNSPETAYATYDKLSEVSCASGEYTFRKALEHCGIEDVLTDSYIKKLAIDLNANAGKI